MGRFGEIELYDVIIVGAGPVGSHVAGRLAGWGHRIIVLEQHEKVGKTACCTGIVGKECLETFPISKEAVLREARSARFLSPSGKFFRMEKETAQACILDRSVFDAAMARNAQARGAEYLLDSKVRDVIRTDNLVRVGVESKGRFADFEGKAVVIASGFGSRLPQKLGFGKNADFVMGAQAEVATGEIDEVEIYLGGHIAPGFFAWLVPTSQGRALAGLLSRRHTGSHLTSFIDNLAKQGRIDPLGARITYGGIPLKPLSRTSGERVIVVGDAAGQVKPTTGGGIYYGLLCAEIAADTMHRAICNNVYSDKLLGDYEKRWRKLLSRELRIGRWARWLFEKLNDRQIDHLFDIVQRNGISESLLNSADFSFDWHSRLILRGLRHLGPRAAVSILWLPISARLSRGSP